MAVKIDNGTVTAVEILNPGKDYYSTPKIDIIETDNKLFFESNDIGIPQSIRFINNGTFYFKDDSIQSYYETPQVLTLSNFELNAFGDGESIEQKINGVVFASGKVASNGWNKGSNILRLVNISGVFREGYPINGRSKGKTANVILNTIFGDPVIAVDTHIFRLANRIKLAPGKKVAQRAVARMKQWRAGVPINWRMDSERLSTWRVQAARRLLG